MKSELSLEKNILKDKNNIHNNDWAVFNLFFSYLKRNRAIIFAFFLLPLIFIFVVGNNYLTLVTKTNNYVGALLLMIIWLVQAAAFSIQTFLAILLDLKQSIVYRRIGLTRISKAKFILIASLFNLGLLILTDIFIFLLVIILGFSLKLTLLINSIFHWQLIVIILFTLAISVLLTVMCLFMSTIIKSRTGQAIASIIVNFVIIIPLMVLVFFINNLTTWTANAALPTIAIVGIFLALMLVINAITVLLSYFSLKLFKWFD